MPSRTTFFTAIDPNAAIKGSVDPLGAQVIWVAAGRKLIHNLTTVSTLLRDFTICLTGLYFAERLRSSIGDSVHAVDVFLRWEQLCAYSRFTMLNDGGFRGVEQVKRRLDGTEKVSISAHRDWQILGNQKVYGIWGLYRSPLRQSGLVEGSNNDVLLSTSKELVESIYLPKLFPNAQSEKELYKYLRSDDQKFTVNSELSQRIALILRPKALKSERPFYTKYLLRGGEPENDVTKGIQSAFTDLIAQDIGGLETFGPREILKLAQRAEKSQHRELLVQPISDLATIERVLGTLSLLFLYLQSQDNQTVLNVANKLKKEWGARTKVRPDQFEQALIRIGVGDADIEKQWNAMAADLHAGNYQELISRVIELNRYVMNSRHSVGAWMEIRDKKLNVKLSSEQGDLTQIERLEISPRYTYFVPTLHRLITDIGVE